MIRHCVLLGVALAATAAHAGPTITIDTSVPFSAKDLIDAIEIRIPYARERIHVTRAGDLIVVTVGERAKALAIDGPPHDLARVVALVIVGLAEPPPISTAPLVSTRLPGPPTLLTPVPQLADTEPLPAVDIVAPSDVAPIVVTAPPTPSRYSIRGAIGYQVTNRGIDTTPIVGSLVTELVPWARFIVSAGIDEYADTIDTAHVVLGRVGLELRTDSTNPQLGFELGATGFAWSNCLDTTSTALGPYGIARVYLPLSRGKLLLEAGFYYVRIEHPDCDMAPGFAAVGINGGDPTPSFDYAGHVGIGVEWPL